MHRPKQPDERQGHSNIIHVAARGRRLIVAVFFQKDRLHSFARLMVCVLLCMTMLCAAGAQVIAESPSKTIEEPPVEESVVQTEIVSAPVQTEGNQLHTGPVLMATDYVVIEGETVPGSSFVLQMNIANLSETAAAYNVLATLKIENVSVAIQEGATNQMYFHEILPMQSVVVQFPLEVYSYCVEENMILSMTMTCYDAAAIHYDFQTMMTPNVDVLRTLQVSSLTVPQFVHRNSSMIINATLTNVEPVALNNIKMHLITQYGEQITNVGQMLSNESRTVNSIYRFPEQQTENIQVYFTYENLSGHEFATDHQKFEVIVYDPAVQNDLATKEALSSRVIMERLVQSTVIPGTDVQLPLPVIVLIIVGFVGYAVVLYIVFRRKRK